MPATAAPSLNDLVNLEGAFGAYDAGYAGWTCTPEVSGSTFQPTSGVAYYFAFRPATQGPSTKVYTVTSTAGATLTSAQNLVSLYTVAAGVLTKVVDSADNSTVWAATAGQQNVALASGTLLEDTIYYLGLLAVGSTTPIFRATNTHAGLNGLTTAAAGNALAFSAGSSLTAMPASVTISTGTVATQKIHIALG